MDFAKQAQTIRQQRDYRLADHLAAIRPCFEQISKDKIEKIINATCSELAVMLNAGETTSQQILYVFAYRTATIGSDLKAITEDNFLEAFEMAKECDSERKRTGRKNALLEEEGDEYLSPLFGIPISIKDTVNMRGFSTTVGCVARFASKQPKDGELIQVFKKAGLIPFVRTNVPQMCMSSESNNLLWGNTENPWDRSRTSGGSSGGGAAVIAARCCPISLGGDIGGSLRIPSDYCGIYTLKSTSQRITGGGHTKFAPSVDGQINVRATMGPMAKCVQDISLYYKLLMDDKNYTNWTKDVYRKLETFDLKMYKSVTRTQAKYRIGYYQSFEIWPATEASTRAVRQVVELLQKKGHTLIPVKIPDAQEMTGVLLSVIVAEGGLKGYHEMLQGEPLRPQYRINNIAVKLPRIVNKGICKVLQYFYPRMAMMLSRARKLSTYEYLRLSDQQKCLRNKFVHMWRTDNLDFIIGPGAGVQACKIGQSTKISSLPLMYANIWNVLDMTVGSLPVTKVREDEQQYQCEYRDPYTKFTKENMIGTAGLPVGVQIISLPFYDQQVLGLMKVIEHQIGFREKNPYPM